jgi:hypothetical protein
MQLEISSPEKKLLVRILDNTLGELRSEVRRTREPTWHDGLKEEERMVSDLIARLRTDG